MSRPDFSQNYFELFGLPVAFRLDPARLGERYRQLQREMHPDRFASAPEHQQRVAIQYSAFVNEAHAVLRSPLDRALYLLELAGLTREEIAAQKVDGGFLIEQMELREKLEGLPGMVDPETAVDHLQDEIIGDIRQHQAEFEAAFQQSDLPAAASACVKMQYLDKLLKEAERIEADLTDG